ALSPGATPELLDAAAESDLPFMPGVATASELMMALTRGFDTVKFFPAVPAGGTAALKALAGPFPQARWRNPRGSVEPDHGSRPPRDRPAPMTNGAERATDQNEEERPMEYAQDRKADRTDIVQKVTRRLIPFVGICYLIAYIDRQNVSYAKLQMVGDLGLSEYAYGLGASLFFIGYFLFEVPSNVIMEKVGARRW